MTEMPTYRSIEESVLGDLSNRMEVAKLRGDRELFESAKEQLVVAISALGSASSETRLKYEPLIDASFDSNS